MLVKLPTAAFSFCDIHCVLKLVYERGTDDLLLTMSQGCRGLQLDLTIFEEKGKIVFPLFNQSVRWLLSMQSARFHEKFRAGRTCERTLGFARARGGSNPWRG
jgi:hypothetical protein